MSVPAITFYASPPGGVCSTSHHYHHACGSSSSSSSSSAHSSVDFDHLSSRPSTATPATPSSTIQRPIGGLSRLFSPSTPSVAPLRPASQCSSFTGGDGLGLLLQQHHHHHDRAEELGSSHSYSASIKCGAAGAGGVRDHGSPVSVFQGPVSCSAVGGMSVGGGSARGSSPLMYRMARGEGGGGGGGGVDFRTGRDRMFNRFLTTAVGSCLDYDSRSVDAAAAVSVGVGVGVGLDLEDLPFHLDDGYAGAGLGLVERQPYAEVILSKAQNHNGIFHNEFVIRAFYEAEKAHRGQMRASGDPYLQHCVDTAILLADIGANTTVVAAGLLHDTLDDSFITHSYICRTFGSAVADLVEGVSRLSQLSKLARENNTASRTAEAEGLHTMFLAMADARAVLIKLADRLHNMMTLDALPMAKQQRFAKETLEIFAPLANRLGISTWKEQLENLCFKHLQPEQHRELASKLVRSLDEAVIGAAKGKLEQALKKDGVSFHVLSGRYKSLYSIHSKMSRKKLAMDEIHDIQGLRLIVETEEDCYKALEVVHKTWPMVLGRYKDYISHPKFNGYQSLHTVVSSEDGFPLEVQIRTKEMHLQAEFGFAAHWRYKEGDCKYSSFVLQMVEWARWVVSWQCETMSKDVSYSIGKDNDSIRPPCPFPTHSKDCPFSYTPKADNDGPVFVILLENEKMSVQEFPTNSTLRDLFDRVAHGCSRWTSYSFPTKQELRPRLNRVPVSDLKLKLKMGDVVELTPSIPDKNLTEYREEIRRMYGRDLAASIKVGRRR